MELIYTTTFANGSTYVGSTKDFARRRHTHRHELRRGRGINAKVRAAYAASGMPEFREVARLKFGELHELEALVIESLAPDLNVSAPVPTPTVALAVRPFGPHPSIKAFASAVGLSYTHAKRLSGQFSYEACLYKLAYRPEKAPRPVSSLASLAAKLSAETDMAPSACMGYLTHYGSEEAALAAINKRKNRKMPTPAKYFTWNGVRKKLNDWAADNGVSKGLLHTRIHLGWPPQEAAGLVPRNTPERVSCAPKYDCGAHGLLTIKEIAAMAGLSPSAIPSRIKAGWTYEDACRPAVVREKKLAVRGPPRKRGRPRKEVDKPAPA